MFFLGVDGHDFIYERLNYFTAKFDWVICNNTIIKNNTIPRTICIKTDFLPKYVDLLSSIGSGDTEGCDFILLSCSSMYSPAYYYPDETRRILENPHLTAWFSENNTIAEGSIHSHPKMHHFPSGLNFHNAELQRECEIELLRISKLCGTARPAPRDILYCAPFGRELFNDSYCKTFCGVSRNLIRGEPFLLGGIDTYHIGAKNPTVNISEQYKDYYETLKEYKFLICPHEATIDPLQPHIWEALALGVIPVMLYNPLSANLYREFPIWFIDDWTQLYDRNEQFFIEKYCELMNETSDISYKLTADYWFDFATSSTPQNFDTVLKLLAPPSPSSLLSALPLPRPTIIFAFCIYGSNEMYYDGLNENIRIILREFGGGGAAAAVKIHIYAGKSAILSKINIYEGITEIIETGHDGVINMIYRYSGISKFCGGSGSGAAHAGVEKCYTSTLTDTDFYFVRDADSIIGERDLWCILDFMYEAEKNDKISAHIIRDHYHHKSKMTGGLTGFTRLGITLTSDTFYGKINAFKQGDYSVYGNDEEFLNNNIYPLLFSGNNTAPLVHSNFCVFPAATAAAQPPEIHKPILCRNTLTNFCGNVRQIDPFEHFQFVYSDFDVNAQWKWTVEHSAYELFIQTILSLKRTYKNFTAEELNPRENNGLLKRLYDGLKELPYSYRSITVAYLIEAYLKINYIVGCYASYQLYAYCEIHERARKLFWDVINFTGRNLLFMTTGLYDDIGDDDIVFLETIIVYGAYADDWTAYIDDWSEYPYMNVLKRNVCHYENDIIECKKRGIIFKWAERMVWKPVKQIYIMGLDVAPDRIYETKIELARVGLSLDKIIVYLAKKDTDKNSAYLGATKNHADVLAAAVKANETLDDNSDGDVILFLEDDFVFSGDPTERLKQFWGREYNYDICLLAASKMHERVEYDDLVSYSKQYCTTSSAYFVPANNETLVKIERLVREGYDKMKETGDTVTYCIDRYWSKLQSANRMILFKKKIGFQRPSISKITGALNVMLD